MTMSIPERTGRVYKITCGNGSRYVIYNASEIGNPPDHVAEKWYFRPYPVPLGLEAGDPFDTAEAAESAARRLVPGSN